ncbi:DUF5610 domain-containing protein [Lacimicrobium alkaliphilum]|uniref:DUF5610 domain-containing protein n=1 Tax=Lacimicrobium alkaliphilum TaxID=1526571 RepID=A0ABQ1RMN7_9ALTE|nr:DUF5610 domain-containing protein [Lacimicrobium alkaliphilum]GGD73037.1 hypothetical protein GCM10011357_30140 [Lacimicrobium alkaliphilum]
MNLGEIKAFLGDKAQQAGRSDVQNQLRNEGLRQAASQPASAVTLSQSMASGKFVGMAVFSSALNETLTVDNRRPKFERPEPEDKPLFDFEEIAKNVLSFVGGAIRNAQAKGADEDKLTTMFDQARQGVLKGVKMAEKDLAGMMNDEISTGIRKSQDLIEEGLQSLEQKVFGQPEQSQSVSGSYSYSRQDTSELAITTKDGDEVTIRFEDSAQFAFNQSLMVSAPASEREAQAENQGFSFTASQNYQFYQANAFSFSVRGELDESELGAIGDLVGNAADVADEFYNGDVEEAFNQALKLGFDDSELTSYALQLSRNEQTKVIQTYESVSHNDENSRGQDGFGAVKTVSRYLERMLNMVEKAQQTLPDREGYENLINGLVNEMPDVQTPDLLQAINRFHSFNNKLMSNLPQSAMMQTESGA